MSIMHDYEEAMYEQDQEQYEYEHRKFVFQTDFKGAYISNMVNGFSNHKFIGTQKEYDEAIKFYDNHSNGKIIGTFKYTLKEWEEKHPSKPEVKEVKVPRNRWGEDMSKDGLRRSNTHPRYWKYL